MAAPADERRAVRFDTKKDRRPTCAGPPIIAQGRDRAACRRRSRPGRRRQNEKRIPIWAMRGSTVALIRLNFDPLTTLKFVTAFVFSTLNRSNIAVIL